MRINLVLAASLSLFAACTTDDASSTDAGTSVGDIRPIATAARPSNLQMSQPDATALCTPLEAHPPTSEELESALGDCVRTSIGVLCRPLVVATGAEQISGDLELAQVWTSTPCERGFMIANFDSGEITCQPTTTSQARPLCLR